MIKILRQSSNLHSSSLQVARAVAGPLKSGSWSSLRPPLQAKMRECTEFLRGASIQGHSDATFFLGLILAQGKGVPQDRPTAVALWLKAAQEGHVEAQLNAGAAFEYGIAVQRDLERALELYLESSDAGNPHPQELQWGRPGPLPRPLILLSPLCHLPPPLCPQAALTQPLARLDCFQTAVETAQTRYI